MIDDLIHNILTEAGQPAAAVRGMGPIAGLIETVMASSRTAPRASMFDRLLLAQVVASALADALAPALAETLAPEIMKALEHYAPGGKEPATAGAPQQRTRKSEEK
ncbi:hypothetical protein GCM10009835_32450 [Planosporangium flavigriseum]|uniref:Uncharacterized protein n=1 Tax=Planosporangium flavigriseum TaxID=373681 RepID=A0A8J3LLG3_9ACTN|nr:hypothetical protein Pfl04_19030 [Planosporangium flavigriseum]